MDSQLVTLLLIVLGVLVVAVLVAVLVTRRKPAEIRAMERAWGAVAVRTRLVFTPPGQSPEQARLHGVHRQREVAAAVKPHTAFTRLAQHVVYYTHLEAYVRNPARSFLRVNTKGAYRKTDQYLGQPTRPVGDPKMDARYDIKCIPHDLADKLIRPDKSLRERFLALRQGQYVEFEMEGNVLRLEHEGLEQDSGYLLVLFDLMCDVGEAFERLK